MTIEEIPNKYIRRSFMVLMMGVFLWCFVQMLTVETYKAFVKTSKYFGGGIKDMWLGVN